MQDGPNAKQLIAEKIKQSANILVTVSANPSVDALTAALGLSLMLNKMDKHATAVFSGVVPPAIGFLQPNKTFENNVDSLRDFIIALDKDKADRLRYKVEDDVVRIFITPYRTRISEKDLQFSQGDFNVDLIIALGVEDQKDLDQAITAHGRILHDAAVATINAGSQKSTLGSIDWQEGKASSLSEMVAGIADSLKQGILDQQISTALLTGIVASTERFSNQMTTPHVMTVAAGLMAAGANQQLIATKLQSIPAPVSPRREKPKQQQSKQPQEASAPAADGEMHINHGDEQVESPEEAPKQEPKQPPAPAPQPEAAPAPAPEPEQELEPDLPITPPAAQNFDDLKQVIKEDTAPTPAPAHREMLVEPPTPGNHNINAEEGDDQSKKSDEESYLTSHPSWQGREIQPPSMGGTLSATAEQALEDKQREEAEEHRNHKILTHGASAESGAKPASAQQQKPKKQKQQKQQPQQKQKQAPAPAPTPVAPPPMPQPEQVAEPAPAPQPPEQERLEPVQTQPPAEQAPLPPIPPAPEVAMPAPEPAPQPEPEIPVAPPPLVVAEPLSPPPVASAPTPNPGAMSLPPVPQPSMPSEPTQAPQGGAPTLEELERQAAHHAAQAAATTAAPQTLSELEAAARQHTADAAMPAPAPTPPQPQPSAPPMPDFSTLPPLPGAQPAPQQQAPQLPPLPPDTQPVPEPLPEKPQAPPDPAQFRIPTQQ